MAGRGLDERSSPINLDTLPDNQAFVASNEVDSGTLETKQLCANWKAEGKSEVNVYIMEGQLSNQAAVQRTKDIHDVISGPDCGVKVNVIDEQTANWSRDEAQNLMTNWLSTGKPFDGVIANNDEMAIGAIQAMKAAGIDMKSVQVGGVDATQDALAAMQAGDLDVTVFQNAAAQGGGGADVGAQRRPAQGAGLYHSRHPFGRGRAAADLEEPDGAGGHGDEL
jgi:inositol transport system substrate-binding protein